MDLNYEKDSKERMPYEHYMAEYAKCDPLEVSERLGVFYDSDDKFFQLTFMGFEYRITFPDCEISHLGEVREYYPLEEMHYAKLLILRYLLEGRRTMGSEEFKAYRDMPWGEVYYKQFNGRCILRLAYGYANRQDVFCSVMERLHAKKLEIGDCSYEITLLDNYVLRFILWAGDDEFPPSSQILFSSNFPQSFAAEDMAVVGDVTIGTFKAMEKFQVNGD